MGQFDNIDQPPGHCDKTMPLGGPSKSWPSTFTQFKDGKVIKTWVLLKSKLVALPTYLSSVITMCFWMRVRPPAPFIETEIEVVSGIVPTGGRQCFRCPHAGYFQFACQYRNASAPQDSVDWGKHQRTAQNGRENNCDITGFIVNTCELRWTSTHA
jgi:hypothetical protein